MRREKQDSWRLCAAWSSKTLGLSDSDSEAFAQIIDSTRVLFSLRVVPSPGPTLRLRRVFVWR